MQLKNVEEVERENIEQLVSAFGTVLHFDVGLYDFKIFYFFIYTV